MGYNARKAAQEIAFFIMKNGYNPIDRLKAVKLVYLADRASIQRYGFPILDEKRVSMEHGPVNSSTFDYIKGTRVDPEWTDFLKTVEDKKISLSRRQVSEDELDELSDADIDVLTGIWNDFGSMETLKLRNWTHDNLPEWQDPGKTSKPIPLVRIMQEVGVPNDQEQAAFVADFDRIDDIFKELRT